MPVPPKTRLKPTRFFIWMICGLLLGGVAGLTMRLLRPKHYESTAVVAGAFQESGETKLSPTHAKLIARNLGGSLLTDPKSIHENTFIRADDGKIRITVTSTNRYDAREIAREATRVFRSIEHEQDLTLEPVEIRRFTEEDQVVAEDGRRLRTLLVGQAADSGIEDFLAVPGLAKEGNASAQALLANEDFSRRFNRYQEIAIPLGLEGVPGQPTAPHVILLEEPQLATRPAEEPVDRRIWYVIAGGLLFGLAGGLLFGRVPIKPSPATPVPPRPESPSRPAIPLTKPQSPQDW